MTRTKRVSYQAQIIDLFKARPGQWINALDLEAVGGRLSWRSRVSNCRHRPFYMVVENRQRHVQTSNGERFVISEYRYTPSAPWATVIDAPPAWELS